MDPQRILKELQAERARLDEAILAVQRLALGQGAKRRGRPPKWVTEMRKQAADLQNERASPRGKP